MLTASACVSGSAPKVMDTPENILLLVESWVCASSPDDDFPLHNAKAQNFDGETRLLA